MVDISISKILRGGIVTTCSSFIIYFLVVILSPVLPFISLDGIIPLILFITIYILTLLTYFLLPSEISEKVDTEKLVEMEN